MWIVSCASAAKKVLWAVTEPFWFTNFTVNTKGFKYLRFKYYTENNNVPSFCPKGRHRPFRLEQYVQCFFKLYTPERNERIADGNAEPFKLSGDICH